MMLHLQTLLYNKKYLTKSLLFGANLKLLCSKFNKGGNMSARVLILPPFYFYAKDKRNLE